LFYFARLSTSPTHVLKGGLLHVILWPHLANMASCVLDGSSDMYGLGIRMGFYLQWYGSILASWFAPSEIEGLRFTNSLFVASTFLALVISAADGSSNLQTVDIYVTLLLTFGYYLFLVPLYVWRIVTGGNARLDPTRWPTIRSGALYNVLTSLLLLAVGAFQLWFWAWRIAQPGPVGGCQEYGFFFARIRLNSLGFRVLNLVLYSLVMFACLTLLLVFAARKLGLLQPGPDPEIRYGTSLQILSGPLLMRGTLAKAARRHFVSCNLCQT
jgi:hypothetical protein